MKELDQYMTPAYAARQLWEELFGDVRAGQTVVEPTCGDGRMLAAIPPAVNAVGYEIDPILAAKAEKRTGRRVVVGDFLTAELPPQIHAMFGNPPFQATFLDRALERVYPLMPDGARAGFILPTYLFQTPSRVLRWNRCWTLSADLLPRTIWPKLMRPILFAVFTRDPKPKLKGLRLYVEADMANSLSRPDLFLGSGSWCATVAAALRELGGRAHVQDIYGQLASRRPTDNPHWKEKIRQSLGRGPFISHGRGVWALAA